MSGSRWLEFAVVGAYMLGVLGMGLRFSRRQGTTDSYFTARRSIPAWALGLSMLATIITSISFIAYPGNAFAGNWAELVPGLMVVPVLAVTAMVIVPFFRHFIGVSAYEYFEQRFNTRVRLYGSAMFSIGHFSKMGFIMYLVALTVQSLTGWSIYAVIVAIGAITIIYTCIGGIEAVIWIEVVQCFILLMGLLVSLAYLLFLPPGGALASIRLAWVNHKMSLGSFGFEPAQKCFWVMALYGLFFYLQKYTADQTVVQRYLVAKSDRGAIKGVAMGGLLCVPVWTLFLLVGSLTWSFYKLTSEKLPSALTKSEQVFPYFLSVHVPAGIAGLILAALFASAMSGMSSDLNCLAAIGVADVYGKLRPGSTDRSKLGMAKLFVAGAGICCVGVAMLLAHSTGAALILYFTISSIVAGGLFGVFFLAFVSSRVNARGIEIGIVASVLFTVYATLTGNGTPALRLPAWNYGWHSLLIGPSCNVVMIVVGYAASWFFPAPAAAMRARTIWGWLERPRQA
jgi:SSS family solute:Na+ symporter